MTSMNWKQSILLYRERFKRLDRKWHLLIGSQLLFGMFVVRMKLHGGGPQLQQHQQDTQPKQPPPRGQ